MASVVYYFQVHQPHRLRKYSVFHTDPFYFDDDKNGEICRKVAEKCYRPTTALILDLVERHEGNFRVAFALTGTVIEQWKQFCPDVIDLFARLAETGCVEFVGETDYHSLSFLYSQEEFEAQARLHTERIRGLFGQTPRVFRNTELIYTNELAEALAKITDDSGEPRFLGAISEGTDRHLGFRSPNYVYRPPDGPKARSWARAAARSGSCSRTTSSATTSRSASATARGRSGRSPPRSSRAGSTRSTATATSATSSWTTRPSASTSGPRRGSSSSSSASRRRSSMWRTRRTGPPRTTSSPRPRRSGGSTPWACTMCPS